MAIPCSKIFVRGHSAGAQQLLGSKKRLTERLQQQASGPASSARGSQDLGPTASPKIHANEPVAADPYGGIADGQVELIPLRIDAAILLDRALRLKDALATEREAARSSIPKRLRKLAAALRGAGKAAELRKKDQDLKRCAAVLLKSGLFDFEYYLRRNPDVAAAGVDPVMHYILHGAAERRSPGPYFSTRWYLEQYPDVAASGKNPLYHFILLGYAEGRLPRPKNPAAPWTSDPERHAAPQFGIVAAPNSPVPTSATRSDRISEAPAAGTTSSSDDAHPKARFVIYTALFGNYDDLFLPSPEQAAGCDFVVFTDQTNVPPPWRQGVVDYAANSNSRQNRFYKLLPHRLFPHHEWSLYLDANIDFRMNPIEFLERYCRLGPDFFVFRHPYRATILDELGACIEKKKDDAELMVRQVAQYLDSGFQHTFPLTENNVLLRRHNDPDLVEVSEAWWEEIRSKSGRDQLSLSYVVEQKGYRRIALFEEGQATTRSFPGLRLRPHRYQFYPRDPLDDLFD